MVREVKGKTEFKVVNINGNSSCTQNLIIALEFAFKKPDDDAAQEKKPVLFVISCQNYKAFFGFRLNNSVYTAYPYEEEVLLCEGCIAIVLKV